MKNQGVLYLPGFYYEYRRRIVKNVLFSYTIND